MVRYIIFLSYLGTRYRGAAKQIGCERLMDMDTIAGAVEMCLHANVRPFSLKKPLVYTSSRTDAGVHALYSAIHVDLEHPYEKLYNTEKIIARSNVYFSKCGHEIRLLSIHPVTDAFHSRKSAKSREYFYRFAVAKDPSCHKVPIGELQRSWHVRGKDIDIEAIRRTIPLFLGRKNFETFAAKNRTNREINYVKELMTLNIEEAPPLMPWDPLSDNFNFYHINISARSFLYNQVRRIVGSLIAVASGTITERDVQLMLQVPNNQHWNSRVQMAPPQGLYLKSVNYDPEELERCTIRQEESAAPEPRALSVLY